MHRVAPPIFALLAVALGAAGVHGADRAASETPTAASSALLHAVAQAPALGAARQRIEAARARVGAAGRLSDVELEGMASRGDMPDDDVTMWELNVRQPLPKRGERAADRDRAQAGVSLAEADYAQMAGELTAEVATALAERDAAAARIRVIETQLARLQAVRQSVDARLASGATGRIADRLSVETRVASLQLQLEQERRLAEDAAAEIRGRLGLPPDAAVPPFAAPAASAVVVDEAALLQLAAARSAEAEAMTKMARASARPMTAVGLRVEREQTRMGNGDTIGIAFMSELPFRSRRYAQAEIRAAQAERAAARTDGESARHRIAAALTRAERADRFADLARKLGQETRARLDAEYDALVRTAGAAAGAESSVFQAVEILEQATETEMQTIDAEAAARATRAELWRYLPAQNFLAP